MKRQLNDYFEIKRNLVFLEDRMQVDEEEIDFKFPGIKSLS